MTIFTDNQARAKLDAIPDQARKEGAVRIRCDNSEEFVLRPSGKRSPLHVGHIDLKMTAEVVVRFIRETRERGGE